MSVRERIYELTTEQDVNEFLTKFPTGAIFKAGSCHKTMEGFGHVEAALAGRPDIHMGFIRVIESRPASNHVAELTGITHESPQFILFLEGKPVFDVDNWDITPEIVDTALEHHLGVSTTAVMSESSGADLSGYLSLLDKFVGGKLPEDEFEAAWLEVFKADASPRSRDEFQLLNSLYGEAAAFGLSPLKDRAAELAQALRTL